MCRFFMYILKIGSISYFRETNAFNPVKPMLLQVARQGVDSPAVIYWLKSLTVKAGSLVDLNRLPRLFFSMYHELF